MGNDFGEYPLLTQHFNLPTQYQENYDIKYRIYLESMLMQFYGYYKCNIAFVVLWLATYFALFSNWGIMSITNALKMTIFQKSILQIQNILMAMSKLVCINKLIHMFTHFGFATQKRFKKCPSLKKLLPRNPTGKKREICVEEIRKSNSEIFQ